jgi:putative two-component system response regulator
VGVPDSVLLKPDRLTNDEFDIMKRHTTYANDIITSAEQRLGNSSFLRVARELAYTHQEKWDGSGYPQGLKGEEIPLAGRIMAIADVYDALISRRPYKDKMPHEAAVAIIIKGSGAHFDPKLVEAFLQIADEFKKIASRFIDKPI